MTTIEIPTTTDPKPAASDHFLVRAVKRPAAVISLSWLALVVLGSVFAGWVAPYDPLAQDLSQAYAGPSRTHWLGADQLGRDLLSRILYGGRTSLLVTAEALVVYIVIGVLIGVTAGYLGGWVDRFLMRLADLLQSMPSVIILLVVLAIFSHNETAAMVTLGLLASSGLARVVRASTVAVRAEPFVASAQVAGLSRTVIIRRHLLPQIAGPVIVLGSILAASALLVETALDFLGLGVQPPAPSWGGLVNDASIAIYRQPWLLVPSGGIVLLTAVAFGVLGDVVRDATSDRGGTGGVLSWRRMRIRVLPGTPPKSARPLAVAAPASAGTALLSVRGLTVRLPAPAGSVTIVDRVDLEVFPGEIVGLVGESGCGKTMLVSALMRLLPAGGVILADELTFDGADLLALSESQMAQFRGRRIGFISQEPIGSLDPAYTVAAQLREVIVHHHSVPRREATVRAVQLLRSVGLPDPENIMARYPHELSGGMAQRVSIARTLAGEPDLLIADEPTTALDVTVQAGILDLLRDICRDRGMALVLVTHDWGVVADLCSRAIVMYAGQVIENAPILDLFDHPRHPYTAALLAADPGAHPAGQRLPAIPGTVVAPGRWPTGCRFADRCPRMTAECRLEPVPLFTLDEAEHRCIHPLVLLTVEETSHGE